MRCNNAIAILTILFVIWHWKNCL